MFEKHRRSNYFTSTYGKDFSQFATIALIVVGLFSTSYFWNRDLEFVRNATIIFVDPTFANFMNESYFNFNGDGFGGQDLSILLFLFALIVYLITLMPKNEERYILTRIRSGFIIASSIVLFVFNRVLATFFARVNPEEALYNPDLYTSMLKFGKYSITDAIFNGCFTSGFTTLATLMITLAFISLTSPNKLKIVLNFIIFSSWGIIMGITRVISGENYPTDVLWGYISGVLLIIWIYFKILHVPDQESGKFEIYAKYGELRWGISFIFHGICVGTVLIGIKFAVLNFEWYHPILIIMAIFFAILINNNLNTLLYGPIIYDETEKTVE
ncbi:phosphatase PAP2 family protein [Promethearchaeum syntrophicum]|uniref:Phosphatase PAP2 family protein n=1 Tax=Promethearchaeum syntrophicum TaxID=2594042 RepID=A0A5B9DE62_9ARCH|nr:phosphatase PAP2 family protein [Candidatus Prometheoarchaeum syntrophicum]